MSIISILIISDTHNEWPYSPNDPTPKADIFIHCGDLTQYGGFPSLQRAIENIKTVDAELKLVIAGNHDVDLDPAWLNEFAEDEEDLEIGARCLSFMMSQQDYGIHYLNEGMHTFTLKDGRSLTLYATPYTPRFGEFAFSYGEDEDRFNEGAHILAEGLDIVVSHGPPALPSVSEYKLDLNRRLQHCGCEKLAKALQRARPRLCCFGHIHEGRGAVKVEWTSMTLESTASTGLVNRSGQGIETVLVNAAVFGGEKGWLVNLEV